MEFAQGFKDIAAVAVFVRHDGIRPDPDAVIDAASEMLGELAVNLLGYDRSGRRVMDAHGDAVPVSTGLCGLCPESERNAQ